MEGSTVQHVAIDILHGTPFNALTAGLAFFGIVAPVLIAIFEARERRRYRRQQYGPVPADPPPGRQQAHASYSAGYARPAAYQAPAPQYRRDYSRTVNWLVSAGRWVLSIGMIAAVVLGLGFFYVHRNEAWDKTGFYFAQLTRNPRIELDTDHGKAGAPVTVSGHDFDRYEAVEIYLTTDDKPTEYGTDQSSIPKDKVYQANAEGELSAGLKVPAGLRLGSARIVVFRHTKPAGGKRIVTARFYIVSS